jgi:hypothetical protein
VWSFAVNKKLNRGPWPPQRQPPKEAYSPHFRTRISKENGIKPGPDKATLMVYSLLHDPKQPELVGSDSIDIEWVPNKLPSVQFDSIQFAIDSNGLPLLRLPVGCGEKGIRRIRFHANDSDGQCDSLRIWSLKGYAPSLPNFDTSLSCEMRSAEVLVSLIEPKKDDKEILSTIGTNGAIEYDNTLIAEIVDDNGERARDTAHFRTFRNVPPEGTLEAPDEKFYLVGDSVPFTVHAHDPDGFFSAIFVSWVGTDSNQYFGNRYMSNISRLKNDAEFTEYVKFNEAESTQFWATLADNCSETYETPRRGVHVAGSKPPVISKISLGQIHRAGDTLSVRLEVAGSDPDGSLFRDRIASVRIIWDEDRDADAGNIDSLFPNSSTFNVEMTHKYNRPASGPPIRINIRARDAHDSLADTTYLFNPPESLPPLTLPLR